MPQHDVTFTIPERKLGRGVANFPGGSQVSSGNGVAARRQRQGGSDSPCGWTSGQTRPQQGFGAPGKIATPLGRADLEFKVKRDGEMFGHLKVSNGSIVWTPKNAKRGKMLPWVKFDEIMQEHGQSEKG